jgi:hypothetical protein
MNVTHRNWTGVGSPECNIEPIIDPAGLITPFKDGWSIDIWIKKGDEIFFPSRHNVTQELINNFPIVKTSYKYSEIRCSNTVYTSESTLVIDTEINNEGDEENFFELVFAIRPYNPEGISLVKEIEYFAAGCIIKVNKCNEIFLPGIPDEFSVSNFTEGDAAGLTEKGRPGTRYSVYCKYGLATAAAVYRQTMLPNTAKGFKTLVKLESTNSSVPSLKDHIAYWKDLTGRGIQINTPEKKVNNIFEASVAALLMLTDKDEIMPGPFTYHQFWFRDAAYMLNALDKTGYPDFSKKVIDSFKKHQDDDGYFRSQKGEWDSNGQAIWTIYQHYIISGNTDIISQNFNECYKAIKWIEKKRQNNKFSGLLPAGLSAEHLGLSDYYYWDNFWSLAGIDAFINMCRILKKEKEKESAQSQFNGYFKSVNDFINDKCRQLPSNIITAGPARNADCGMIGSICAIYPLALPIDPETALNTLDYIYSNYFTDGLFFQNFIHSGKNIYLTIQTAHAYLLLGKREQFLKIMCKVTEAATPVFNYPEAIHPRTQGGVMGDGHHGWAAAEYILAVRDAFLYETVRNNKAELIFFSGIPPEWFSAENELFIKNAPASAGTISAFIKISGQSVTIKIDPVIMRDTVETWKIVLPFRCKPGEYNEQVSQVITNNSDTILVVKPGKVSIQLCKDTPEAIHF